MKQPVLLREGFYAVEVPEHLLQQEYCFEQSIVRMVKGLKGDDELLIRGITKKCGSVYDKITVKLPEPGTWQIICTTSTPMWDQAVQVVESSGGGFVDYDKGRIHNDIPFADPYHSLQSLLTSKGLTGKNYLIIQNV